MKILNSKQLLVMGFGAVLALMVLIVIVSLDQMYLTFERIEHVVNNNNIKTRLVSDMLIAARERTISLQKMVTLEDVFERDDEWMRFNSYGAKFANARTHLIELGLSEEEKRIIEQQGALSARVVPVQRHIAELALADKTESAQAMLFTGAIPGQDQVFVQLYQFLNLQENESHRAVADVEMNLSGSSQYLWLIIGLIVFGGVVIAYLVINRIAQAEHQLSQEKDRAQVTLHSIGDGVITTDSNGLVKYMNGIAEQLTGFSATVARSCSIAEIFPIISDLDREQMIDPVMDVISRAQTHNSDGHATLIRGDEKEFAIEYTASPIKDRSGVLVGVVLVFRDVTEMRAMAHQLGYQASHDALTGLINRREFENRVEMALLNARSEVVNHAMCYLDLDQFKVVNDTCGHVAGDELLRQLAMTLKREIREGDTLARLGGDEFGVLYLNCSASKAVQLAEHLQHVINDFLFTWDNKTFNIGVSIGLVPIDQHSNLHALLSTADTACYVAKDQGRNRIHCYVENDDILAKREGEMQWVHRITRALEDNRFEVYCQRMLCLNKNNSCDHYEVLVRMVDEDGSIILPMAFIPAAERYNLMNWIDRWVVRNTLQNINKLMNKDSNTVFAMNLSAQSLCDDAFLPYVQEQIAVNRISPSNLCFEITETSAIVNLTRAQHFIATLKEMGCHFALDDFGSGLSSFAYLKNLPVDYLKIDGSFVRDIADDPIDLALVESINQIGHVMGIKTIAEYVESPDILNKLRIMGVDYVQGYEVARPVPLVSIFPDREIA